MICGLSLFFVRGNVKSIVASISQQSTTDEERSDRRSFLAIVLSALLSSLIGGVCRRAIFGGRTGTVAAAALLVLVDVLFLGRSFMVPVSDLAGLGSVLL